MQILEPQQFVTWNEPIEMLYACHGKVRRFCRQLEILPDYLMRNGCNQAVKNDVQVILNYFNQAAPLHHQDEEEQFFPTLLVYAPQAESAIDELERQHFTLHQNWSDLSDQLMALLNDDVTEVEPLLITRFVQAYAKHLTLEEPLFELGKQHIPAEALQQMGKIMFARRQSA